MLDSWLHLVFQPHILRNILKNIKFFYAVSFQNVCKFLAIGPYTRPIPGRPDLPDKNSEGYVLAIPDMPSKTSTINWFLANDDGDLR